MRAHRDEEAIEVLGRLRDWVADNEGGALDRALAARARALAMDLQGDQAAHLEAAQDHEGGNGDDQADRALGLVLV